MSDNTKQQNEGKTEGKFVTPDERVEKGNKAEKNQTPGNTNDDPKVYDASRDGVKDEGPDLMRLQDLHNSRDRGTLRPEEEKELADIEAKVKETQTDENPNKVDLRPSADVPEENR